MKRIVLCCFICLSCFVVAQAQIIQAQAIYLEFVGASIPVGVNYDARFSNPHLGYRVGLAYTIGGLGEMFEDNCMKEEEIRGFNIPVELNYLFGNSQKKSHFELGIGVNVGLYEHIEGNSLECGGPTDPSTIEKNTMFGYFLFGNIGYRYQKAKGFLFRLGISPKFDLGDKNGIGSYVDILSIIPYLSFGYSF